MLSEYFKIKGKLNIKSALAGVGNPIKESVWRSSILKFANRKQEPNVIINPKNGTKLVSVIPELDFNIKNMMVPGTTPLVTMSAKESNCKPKGLETLKSRAKNPTNMVPTEH